MINDTIKTRLEIAKDNQQVKFKEFNDCDELFNNVIKTQPGNAQVFNPRAWSAVEMLVPRMVAKKPTVEYLPREESDQGVSDTISNLFSYWWDKCDGFLKLVEWVKTAIIYGTAIGKVTWKTQTRTVKSHVLDEMGQPVIGEDSAYMVNEEKVTDYDDPELKICNNYHIFFSPGATDTQDASWIIEEYWKPFKDLEKEQEDTKIYTKLGTLKRELTTKETDKGSYENKRHESAGNNIQEDDSTIESVHCIEMWDMLENKQYILAGDVLILERDNPYWHGKNPYIRLVDSIVPFEFYGKGEIAPIKGLQHAVNTLRNMRLDNITQAVAAMWKAKGDVDESELVWQPNGVIHVSDFDDAELIEFPEVTQNSYQEESYLTGEMDHALGTQDFTQIGDSQSDRTATGMSIKSEQLNSRFYHKIQLMEEMALKRLGEMVLSLYQQYVTGEKIIRVQGDNGVEWPVITPQDIAGDYDVVVEAGSTQPVNKDKDKEESVNLLSLFAQDPDLKPEGRYELKSKTLEKFGYKKASEMFFSPEEQQMMQQQQMAQEQEAMQTQDLIAQRDQLMQQQAEEEQMKMKHQQGMEMLGAKGEMEMQKQMMAQGVGQ